MAELLDFSVSDVEMLDEYSVNLYFKDMDYLLSIDENRLLAGFFENAGLPTRYIRYGGWENSLIGGHTLGHYMTAIAQGYANALTKEDKKRRLMAKMNNIADSLALCQKNGKGKNGFIWGAKKISDNPEEQFDNVEKNLTNISTQAWVPWYTMHKIIAGLISMYRLAGIEKAKDVLLGLCDWVCERTLKWDEKTRLTVLNIEYGGMNDCLYSAYAITQSPRHLQAAHIFDEEALFEKVLSGEKDALDKLHANTTIPKFLGALNRYKTVGDEKYLSYAKAFFDLVIGKHCYVTGGVGEWEHFGKDGILDAERTRYNCETCAEYNLLIMARELFKITRDKKYMDYYEEAYVNSILPAMNPTTGMAMYFQPMAAGFFKAYSTPFNSFWCCTGTGMEDFTKLGDSIYFMGENAVYINAFISSAVTVKSARLKLIQRAVDTDEGRKVQLSFECEGEKDVVLKLRMPEYSTSLKICVDGAPREYVDEKGYAVLSLAVSALTKVDINISYGIMAYSLPDNENAFAFKRGGEVLCVKLSDERMDLGSTGVDVTVPKRAILSGQTIRLKDENRAEFIAAPDKYFVRRGGGFCLTGADKEYNFVPYYSLHGYRYAIYMYIKDFDGADLTEETAREIIDAVQPGYGQYENDALHDMKEKRSVGCTSGGTYRYAESGGYFEYRMRVERGRDNNLIVYFSKEDDGKSIRITADGTTLFEGRLSIDGAAEFAERTFLIPKEIVNGAARINAVGEECEIVKIRFSSPYDEPSAAVCEFIYMAH